MNFENKAGRPDRPPARETKKDIKNSEEVINQFLAEQKTVRKEEISDTELMSERDYIDTKPYSRGKEEVLMSAHIEEINTDLDSFNLYEFLESRGIQHDVSARTFGQTKALFESNKDSALAAINFVLEGLSKKDRHILQLKDYEYLRSAIYEVIKKKMAEKSSGSQLIIMKDVLGMGGFGKVYASDVVEIGNKAKEISADNLVVKEVDVSNLIPVRKGLKNSLGVDSPRVMKVYDIEDFGNKIRIYMEKVTGEEMNKEKISVGDFLACLEQAAEGLEAISLKGFAHRDIKFSNIMYEKTGNAIQAKIIDLDLLCGAEDIEETVRKEGFVAGTLRYMPPEGLQDVERLRKKYLKGLKSGGEKTWIRSEAPENHLFIELDRAKRTVTQRFEEIRRETGNDEKAAEIIEDLDVRVDVTKYDVYSLGVMIDEYVTELLRHDEENTEEIREKLAELAEDMLMPISSERASISQVRERIKNIVKK